VRAGTSRGPTQPLLFLLLNAAENFAKISIILPNQLFMNSMIIAIVLLDKKNPTILVFLQQQIFAVAVGGIPWVGHVHKVSGSFQARIGKPGTQNPGPGQVLKLCFVPSQTQKNDVTM